MDRPTLTREELNHLLGIMRDRGMYDTAEFLESLFNERETSDVRN